MSVVFLASGTVVTTVGVDRVQAALIQTDITFDSPVCNGGSTYTLVSRNDAMESSLTMTNRCGDVDVEIKEWVFNCPEFAEGVIQTPAGTVLAPGESADFAYCRYIRT